MARKDQKFRSYSAELKEEILRKYWSRVPARALSVEYGIPQGTIETWNYNFKHGRIGRKRGRQKKNPTLEDYKERYEILKKYQAFLQARRGKK